MNIDETLSYIHAVCWRSSIPGLERIRALLALMGDPQRDMKFILSLIHISEPTRP